MKELYVNVNTGEQWNREVDLEFPPSSPPTMGFDIELLCEWLKELDGIITRRGRNINARFPIIET